MTRNKKGESAAPFPRPISNEEHDDAFIEWKPVGGLPEKAGKEFQIDWEGTVPLKDVKEQLDKDLAQKPKDVLTKFVEQELVRLAHLSKALGSVLDEYDSIIGFFVDNGIFSVEECMQMTGLTEEDVRECMNNPDRNREADRFYYYHKLLDLEGMASEDEILKNFYSNMPTDFGSRWRVGS